MIRGLSRDTIVLCACLIAVARVEATVVLYDASAGTTPDNQGWTYLADSSPPSAEHSVSAGLLTLSTTEAAMAGYFSKAPLFPDHPLQPTMDLSIESYSIEFGMRQVSGSDSPDSDPLALNERNRGGFALIAITNDLRGIELQFQTDHVLALESNTAFSIGESQAFDTTEALHQFDLRLSDSGYQLSADNNVLLQGPLRNYQGLVALPVGFPYATPSFLFFGDDTGRGGAITELTHLQVTAIPEPSSLLLLLLAGAMCVVAHSWLTTKRWSRQPSQAT